LASTSSAPVSEFLADTEDNHRLARLCGPLDSNLRAIERQFGVTISRRNSAIKIEGNAKMRRSALAALQYFYEQALKPMAEDAITLGLVQMHNTTDAMANAKHDNSPVLQTRRTDLQGRTPMQRDYLRAILSHDITFGVGPAGTGKTYLAVACAVDAFERDLVKRIVLTRPAVEAGERLGFLPGDMNQKVDPYLRPLYDALYELMGADRTQKLFERQAIEVAPLAYMRGRTLNHCFVILDEAQNTTPAQMKMFLTRIGYGSKTVVTGDRTQLDLPKGQVSGLLDAERVLKRVKEIAFCEFTSKDVVRHPLVAKIVDAYDKSSKKVNS
jgi:phosphate starvation-inducible protein PhoH and related proteins